MKVYDKNYHLEKVNSYEIFFSNILDVWLILLMTAH